MAAEYKDVADGNLHFLCSMCQKRNVTTRAVEYCAECCEYFCDGCLAYHNQMAVLMTHRDRLVGEDAFRNITETRLTEQKQEPDDTIDWTERVHIRQQQNRVECRVVGLCCLPDGGWILADNNNKVLKRLHSSNRITDRFDMPGLYLSAVCYLPEVDMAAVSTGKSQTVELIHLDGVMKRAKSAKMNHHCLGITHCNNMLYVTAQGGHEVFEYLLPDLTLRRTITSRRTDTLSDTHYVTVDISGLGLYVMQRNKGVSIFSTDTGSALQQTEVCGSPMNLCSADDNSVFVLVRPWKIVRIDRGGRIVETLDIKEIEGRFTLLAACYDNRSDRLAVSVFAACDYLFMFQMK